VTNRQGDRGMLINKPTVRGRRKERGRKDAEKGDNRQRERERYSET